MYQTEKRKFILYVTVITLSVIIAKFILDGGLTIISSAIKPFIIACILIYLVQPFTKLIDRKTPFTRVQSVLLAYFLFIFIIVGFILMITPSIVRSIQSLTHINYNESDIINFLNGLPILSQFIDTSSISDLLNSIEELVVEYSSNLLNYSSSIISSISSVVGSIVIIVIAFIMSFYALKDSDEIFKKTEEILFAFLPDPTANSIVRVAKLVDLSFKKYLVGKLYTCFILGAMITSSIIILNAFSPLSIPYALLVGVIVGITNFIPYIGGTLGAIPSVLIVMFSGGFLEAMIVWGIITIAQQIDNMIVGPKVLGDSVGLKPFWILTGITVGGSLFGIMGMILSVPIMSVILQLIDERVDAWREKNKSSEDIEKTIEENIE